MGEYISFEIQDAEGTSIDSGEIDWPEAGIEVTEREISIRGPDGIWYAMQTPEGASRITISLKGN